MPALCKLVLVKHTTRLTKGDDMEQIWLWLDNRSWVEIIGFLLIVYAFAHAFGSYTSESEDEDDVFVA